MGDITTGTDSVFYWGLENSFVNTGGFGASDLNQAFNPIEGGIDLPMPFYEQEIVFTQDSLDPNVNFIFDTGLTDGEGIFPNEKGMIYHDPFLMLALVFTKKTDTGTWGGGAATYGKLTGSFLTNSHVNSVMFQYKTPDRAGTTVEEKSVTGIKCTEFRIGFVKGGLLRTKYSIITANEEDNIRAYTPVAAFDDGTWADWAKSTYYLASDCVVYWDDSFAAELVDIEIEECWFIISTPQEYTKVANSLKTQFRHNKHRAYSAEITGLVFGDTELDEFRLAFSSKTKKNLRLQWDSTASEKKFIDIDDAFISGMSSTRIPGADEAYRVTLTFKGISCDYEGNFENLTDPTGRVTV